MNLSALRYAEELFWGESWNALHMFRCAKRLGPWLAQFEARILLARWCGPACPHYATACNAQGKAVVRIIEYVEGRGRGYVKRLKAVAMQLDESMRDWRVLASEKVQEEPRLRAGFRWFSGSAGPW